MASLHSHHEVPDNSGFVLSRQAIESIGLDSNPNVMVYLLHNLEENFLLSLSPFFSHPFKTEDCVHDFQAEGQNIYK